MFDSEYPFHFIQSKLEKDESRHLKTYIYSFRSPVTRLKYIIRAEYHEEDVFCIKFYPTSLKHSEKKYSLLTNRHDVSRIIKTVSGVIVELLKEYPGACFAFYASPIFDSNTRRFEAGSCNKRYKVYFEFIKRFFGPELFAHFAYRNINGYLLVNRKHPDVDSKEKRISQMFIETYRQLPEDISTI